MKVKIYRQEPAKAGDAYRQGDVLFEHIDSIPEEATLHAGPIIAAHGEVTGHAHRVEKGARGYKVPDSALAENEVDIIEVAEALAYVTHEEHDPIELKKGVYRVTIQREYSPQEIRRVLD